MARHELSTVKGSTTVVLDHYLEILRRKPGAFAGSTALAQARKSRVFTAEHEAFWAAARRAHGDAEAPVSWSRCCCCTATCPTPMSWTVWRRRPRAGAVRADVVAVEARRIADRTAPPQTMPDRCRCPPSE